MDITKSINVQIVSRRPLDIQEWQTAFKLAEGESKNRDKLYNLYRNIADDGHLRSVMNKRTMAITNAPIMFKNAKGENDEDITKLARSQHFIKLLRMLMKAKFYGHSLIQLDWRPQNTEPKTTPIKEQHVKPEWDIVVRQPHEKSGIAYKKLPDTIWFGEPDDMGLLLPAAPYTIYKRGGFGDWAEWAELFGRPFWKGTYENEDTNNIIVKALSEIGGAGYITHPSDGNIEAVTTTGQTGAMPYDDLRKACNEELSILILGQTMTTTDSAHSGFAQSKVHSEVQAMLHADDRRDIISILNTRLINVLQHFGYNTQGGEFYYPEFDSLTLKERIEIDLRIADKVPVDDDYFYNKYGIPKPVNYNQIKKDTTNRKTDNLSANLHENVRTRHALTLRNNDTIKPELFEQVMQKLYKWLQNNDTEDVIGLLKNGEQLLRQTVDIILKAINTGIAQVTQKPDAEFTSKLTENLWIFAGCKTFAQLNEIAELMYDVNNEPRQWTDFRKQVIEIHPKYNELYLQTEYNHAISASHMAAKWKQYELNADKFNLQYRTAGDSQVRAAHRRLNGTTLPANDTFWRKYYPPNGWGCRCNVVQVNINKYNKTDKQVAEAAAIEALTIYNQDGSINKQATRKNLMWAHNPGIDNNVFPEGHQYYKVAGKTRIEIENFAKSLQ